MNPASLTRKLVVTDDGSHTLFVSELNEHYHSVHGAVQESMHVFIQMGLNYFANTQHLSILEVGFGTGLNALLTLQEAYNHQIEIAYTSIEKYPISPNEIEALNYSALIESPLHSVFKQMHSAPWGQFTEIRFSDNETANKGRFKLKKLNTDFLHYVHDDRFNLVYFDAFSPGVQPELWSEDVFKRLYNAMRPNGILVTYSAKGFVKQNLRSAGFKVKRLPGPPGKREMLRATKEAEN